MDVSKQWDEFKWFWMEYQVLDVADLMGTNSNCICKLLAFKGQITKAATKTSSCLLNTPLNVHIIG